jgi:hypothetical protein
LTTLSQMLPHSTAATTLKRGGGTASHNQSHSGVPASSSSQLDGSEAQINKSGGKTEHCSSLDDMPVAAAAVALALLPSALDSRTLESSPHATLAAALAASLAMLCSSSSTLSSSGVALATLGASTLDAAKLFSLFGSWLHSLPLATLAAISAASLASPCGSTLSGDATQPAMLDGTTSRDAMASALWLAGATLNCSLRATLAAASADAPVTLCGSSSALSSSGVALAMRGDSTLDDAKLFSLFGSWLHSLPLAMSAVASTFSPFKLNGNSLSSSMSQIASLDNSSSNSGNSTVPGSGKVTVTVSGRSSGAVVATHLVDCKELVCSGSNGGNNSTTHTLNLQHARVGGARPSFPQAFQLKLCDGSLGGSKPDRDSHDDNALVDCSLAHSSVSAQLALTRSVSTPSDRATSSGNALTINAAISNGTQSTTTAEVTHQDGGLLTGSSHGSGLLSRTSLDDSLGGNTIVTELSSPLVSSPLDESQVDRSALDSSPRGGSLVDDAFISNVLIGTTLSGGSLTRGSVGDVSLVRDSIGASTLSGDAHSLSSLGVNTTVGDSIGEDSLVDNPYDDSSFNSSSLSGGILPGSLQSDSSDTSFDDSSGISSNCASFSDGALSGGSLNGRSPNGSTLDRSQLNGSQVFCLPLDGPRLDGSRDKTKLSSLQLHDSQLAIPGFNGENNSTTHSLGGARVGGAQPSILESQPSQEYERAHLITAHRTPDCNVKGAQLGSSTRGGTHLDGSSLDGSSLGSSPLSDSSLDSAQLDSLPLCGLPLNDPSLNGSQLDSSQLERLLLDALQVNGSVLNGSSPLNGSPFDGLQHEGSQLDSSPLDGSQVDGSALNSSPISGSLVNPAFTIDALIVCALSGYSHSRGSSGDSTLVNGSLSGDVLGGNSKSSVGDSCGGGLLGKALTSDALVSDLLGSSALSGISLSGNSLAETQFDHQSLVGYSLAGNSIGGNSFGSSAPSEKPRDDGTHNHGSHKDGALGVGVSLYSLTLPCSPRSAMTISKALALADCSALQTSQRSSSVLDSSQLLLDNDALSATLGNSTLNGKLTNSGSMNITKSERVVAATQLHNCSLGGYSIKRIDDAASTKQLHGDSLADSSVSNGSLGGGSFVSDSPCSISTVGDELAGAQPIEETADSSKSIDTKAAKQLSDTSLVGGPLVLVGDALVCSTFVGSSLVNNMLVGDLHDNAELSGSSPATSTLVGDAHISGALDGDTLENCSLVGCSFVGCSPAKNTTGGRSCDSSMSNDSHLKALHPNGSLESARETRVGGATSCPEAKAPRQSSITSSPCSIMSAGEPLTQFSKQGAAPQEAWKRLPWLEAHRLAQHILSADPEIASVVTNTMQASRSSGVWTRHQRRSKVAKVSVLRCDGPGSDDKRRLVLYCGGKDHLGGIAVCRTAMRTHMELLRVAAVYGWALCLTPRHAVSPEAHFRSMIDGVNNTVMMLSNGDLSEQQQHPDDLAVAESLLDLSSTKERALESALASVGANEDESVVRSRVKALGHSLGTKRMESGSFKAITAVLERITERHSSDKEAYQALGAKKQAYFHYKKLINEVNTAGTARAGISGGSGGSGGGPSAQDAVIGSQLPRLSSNHLGGVTDGMLATAHQRLVQHFDRARGKLLEGGRLSPISGDRGQQDSLHEGVYLSPPMSVALDTDVRAPSGTSGHDPGEWVEFLDPALHLFEGADTECDIFELMSSPEVRSWLVSPEDESASTVSDYRSGGVFGENAK